MKPIDVWVWDAEAQEVVALDVADKRGGDAVPVDFTDEPVGVLAAAAPDMARALTTLVALLGEDPVFTDPSEADCYAALHHAQDALRKAGVIPTQLPDAPDENQA